MIPSAAPLHGFTVTEGDILVPDVHHHELVARKIIGQGDRMWPRDADGRLVVAYVITDGMNSHIIHKALSHWQNMTCVQFVEYVSEDEVPKPYVRFRDSSVCASSVGLVNATAQNDVHLSTMCPIQSVIHEVGHRLGFIHEQSRIDRDDYITIVYDNIEPGLEKNFLIYGMTQNYSVPYDYSSIMHYDTMAFSNGKGPTILTRQPLYQEILGEHFNHGGLSFMDAKIFNIAYGCIVDWKKACGDEVGGPCLHEGYVKSSGGCGCVCPLGTSGRRCEEKSLDYNDALLKHLSPLSGVVEEPTTIDSWQGDGRGRLWPMGVRFTKVITAPACYQAALTVTSVRMMQRIDGGCRIDYVQIRLSNSTTDPGRTFCGTDLTPGQTFWSHGQVMLLHVRVSSEGHFQARVAFERLHNC